MPLPDPPPITTNLLAWYTGGSFDTQNFTWRDLSGQGNHAEVLSPAGTLTVRQGAPGSANHLGGQPHLFGNSASRIVFPSRILPAGGYTLFHVARYDGASRGRILTSPTDVCCGTSAGTYEFFSGFYWGKSGVAYHATPLSFSTSWITPNSDRHGDAWVLSSDQFNTYRSQGLDRTTRTPLSNRMVQDISMCINCFLAEYSDWSVAAVLAYRGELSTQQMMQVEDYLADMYALPMHRPRLYSMALPQGEHCDKQYVE